MQKFVRSLYVSISLEPSNVYHGNYVNELPDYVNYIIQHAQPTSMESHSSYQSHS